MTHVLFDGAPVAPPPCLAGYPVPDPVPPACAGCEELREFALRLADRVGAAHDVLAHLAEKRAGGPDDAVGADWLAAAGFALAAPLPGCDYWEGPWAAYSGGGSARHRSRLLYWSDSGFLVEQELADAPAGECDLVKVPGPATRRLGAALLAIFPPAVRA